MEICLSLESVQQSPLVREPTRLVDMKVHVKDVKETISYFKELATQMTEEVDLTFEVSPQHPNPKHKRLLGLTMSSLEGNECFME